DMYGKKLKRKYGASSSSQLTGSSTKSRSGPPAIGTRGRYGSSWPNRLESYAKPNSSSSSAVLGPSANGGERLPRGVESKVSSSREIPRFISSRSRSIGSSSTLSWK